MARHLLFVSMRVDCASPNSAGEAIHPMASANALDAGIGDPNAVVALHVPDDPDRPEVVRAAQVKDFSTTSGAMAVG
jgi:hypothetical protein